METGGRSHGIVLRFIVQRVLAPVVRLLGLLGFGGLDLEVQLDSEVHPRGTRVSGVVRVYALLKAQRVQRLSVSFCEQSRSSSSVYNDVATIVLGQDLEVHPGRSLRFPFSIQVPDGARITSNLGVISNSPSRIVARVKTARERVVAQTIAPLVVVPHREVNAVFAAMGSLDFEKTEWFAHHVTPIEPQGKSGQCYLPPSNLRDRIDAVSLVLQVSGDQMTGSFIVNWKETGLIERLQALAGRNRRELPFMWQRKGLLAPDGKPNFEAIVPRLKAMLDAALFERDDPSQKLLRPADSPDDASAILVRPAQSAGHESADVLIRPADAP